MKKRPLSYLFCIIALMGGLFVTSCNDDDYPGAAPDEITAHYSNKLSDGTRANLALTYSGNNLIGKSVNFETDDSRTAKLTLQCILPHEAETQLAGISLVPDGQDGYTFSGNGTGSQTGTTFGFSGTVQKGKLTLDLRDVMLPSNPLTQASKLNLVTTGEETTDKTEKVNPDDRYDTTWKTLHATGTGVLQIPLGAIHINVGDIVGKLAGNFLKTILGDINFDANGNIIAVYAGIPENLDVMEDLLQGNGILNRPDADWKTSPANLASYYMTDGNTVYITPNVDMIIRQIRLNQADTRADDNLLTVITKLYAVLNQWSTTGIKLTVAENPKEYVQESTYSYMRYDGDYTITITKEELEPLFALMGVLPDALREISIGSIPVLGETTLGTLADILSMVGDFSLTFYFNAV